MGVDVISDLPRPAAAPEQTLPSGQDDVSLPAARLLKLLADSTRRRIFLALMRGETCNCELMEDLGLAQNLISHHIRRFREAGLLDERRHESDARWVYYRLNVPVLTEAWAGLEAAFNPGRIGSREANCGPATCSAADPPPLHVRAGEEER